MEENELLGVSSMQTPEETLFAELSFYPAVDVYETDDDFVLIANMPGVVKENLRLQVQKGNLSILGKINYNEVLNRKYILRENRPGHFFRRFKLSDSIDENKIAAEYRNGQLIVNLPKHERIKQRDIKIN